MAAPPGETVEFGPRRAPVWLARIFGAVAALAAIAMIAIAAARGRQTAGLTPLLGFFGLIWGAFGAWMLYAASRMSRFRAIVTPAALRLIASKGRSVWFQGALAEATIPWLEVQGFSRVDTANPAAPGGAQATYLLYTKDGDFSLNNLQWENLDLLMREIARRSGHGADQIAPERAAAQSELRSSERRLRSVQRVLGWVVLVTSGILLLPVIAGALAHGFSSDLGKAAMFLVLAMGVAASVIRFYRPR